MTEKIKRATKSLVQTETQKFRDHWHWYVVGVVLFVVLPTLNYYFVDGVYYNRVISYNYPVEAMALRTDKDEYCPGETIYIETNFCKNRHVENYDVQYWMSNGRLLLVETRNSLNEENGQLPLGCYPDDGSRVFLSRLHEVPEDAEPGFHFTVGLTKHTISGGRIREQEIRTIPYSVKSRSQCEVEELILRDNI